MTLEEIKQLIERLGDPLCHEVHPVSAAIALAGCWHCHHTRAAREAEETGNQWLAFQSVMMVCPTCGNKRCPKASWHGYQCSDSNDPSQTPVGDPPPAQVLQVNHQDIIRTLVDHIGQRL